jgi:type IV pilus assembly protein PilQ
MNLLQLTYACGRKIAAASIITSSLLAFTAGTATAQRIASPSAATMSSAPQDQGRMYGDPGFRGEPINLNVVNADIRDILNYITEQYGINFVIDKSVKAVPVTVNVSNVPWNVALDSVLRSQGLGVQVNGNILRVAEQQTLAEEQAVRQKIESSKLDDSPLYTEFIRLNYARASGSLPQGTTTSGTSAATESAVSNTLEGGSGGGNAGQSGGAEGLLPIIKRRLSRRGSIETDGRSNTLIITDVRENIDAVRQLVALLDQPESQIEIEARIVVATRNFSRDVGVQLSGIALSTNGGGGSLGTIPGTAAGEGELAGAGTRANGIPVGIGPVPNGSLASSIPNTVLGLTTGIFGTAQISVLLTAGEQKGQAKTIATPRVSTLNNRSAKVKSGLKIPIQTATPSGGGAVASITYIDVPLSLEITPQISNNGNVILSITAENSSLADGGAISTQSVETQVMVPDGGTTVVGGVLSDNEQENQNRTPGISSIPLLGNLFKRKGVFRNTNELLFFITPRILRPDYQMNQTSGGNQTTTIIQPVPLGNPPSNSEMPGSGSPQRPVQTGVPTALPVTVAPPPVVNPNKP